MNNSGSGAAFSVSVHLQDMRVFLTLGEYAHVTRDRLIMHANWRIFVVKAFPWGPSALSPGTRLSAALPVLPAVGARN